MGWGGYTQLGPALQTNKQPNNHSIIVPLQIFCWTYWTVEIWKTALRTNISHTRPTILDQTWAYHTGLDRTRPNPTQPYWTRLDRTGPDWTVPDQTVPYRTVPYRTVPYRTRLSQDFHRTFSGLSQNFLRTCSWFSSDFLSTFFRTLPKLSQEFLRTLLEQSKDLLPSLWTISRLSSVFSLLSEDFLRTLRTFSGPSAEVFRTFSIICQGFFWHLSEIFKDFSNFQHPFQD